MSIERLQHLKIENELKGIDMQAEAGRFAALASRHINGVAPQVVTAFNLFQTPPDIAARMARLVVDHVKPGALILEPSAGLGRLWAPLWMMLGTSASYVLIDQAADCVRELYKLTEQAKNVTLKQGDFLGMKGIFGPFDSIIMNPPFKMWRDIKHIKHALTMLKPGGLLVALCANGPRQNEELKPLATTWEVLPAGSFKSEGTGVSVAMLTVKT